MSSYTNRVLIGKRLKLKTKNPNENPGKKSVFLQYWEKYCKNSQLHGIRYLSRETSPNIERKVWFVFVAFGILCTAYMYVALSIRYKEQLLQTVVDNSQLPVYEVVFPSVALCTRKRINWTKFRDAEKIFVQNQDSNLKQMFRQFIEYFQYFRFENISEIHGIDNINLESLNFLNITAFAEFLSFRCDDFVTKCVWRRQEYPCCDLFVLRRTEVGFCMVFNSLVSSDDRMKKVSIQSCEQIKLKIQTN